MADAPSLGSLSAPQATGGQLSARSQAYVNSGSRGGYGNYVAGQKGSGKRKKKKKGEDEGEGAEEPFEPDTSNQFTGDVNLTLQNELADLAGLWGGGGEQPQQVAAPPAPAPAQMDPEQTEMLRGLMELWASPENPNRKIRPRETYMAEREAKDPVGYANMMRQMPWSEWGPGGVFEGRSATDLYTPEYLLASQGNTAENQIAQMGGSKSIDQQELARFNDKIRSSRRRSFV